MSIKVMDRSRYETAKVALEMLRPKVVYSTQRMTYKADARSIYKTRPQYWGDLNYA